jgi:EAL and modified HD-GYP domain-containing signal transduction protein
MVTTLRAPVGGHTAVAPQELPQEVAYIGRQPICRSDGGIEAYELLFRSQEGPANSLSGTGRTANVLLSAFIDLGLDRVVGHHKAFVNLTREFLTLEYALPPRPDLLVLEVLEDIAIDAELIRGVVELKQQGFTIALDDVVSTEQVRPLLDLADIVKVDLRRMPAGMLEEEVALLRTCPVRLLAEKVETAEEMEACRRLGFELFQGYFLSKPQVLTQSRSGIDKRVVLRVLAKTASPETNFQELAQIVQQDAGLCCKFLRYVNSISVGARGVHSVQQALVMLGSRAIRSVVLMLQLAGVSKQANEMLVRALVRGTMCRRLGEKLLPREADSLCTLGILSTLDAMFGERMEDLAAELPIPPEMKAALLTHSGPLGRILECVAAYELGENEHVSLAGVHSRDLVRIYLESVAEAEKTMALLVR